jgi:oligopeptide/dipeptide ABC transporter ATP-binding protein
MKIEGIMTKETLLEVRELRSWFISRRHVVRAVDGVSFTVKKGEILGLVGESGCGKSATCRSLIRLLQPPGRIVSGSILYGGTDITKASEKQMRGIRGKEIGMIFQEPMNTLNPVTTIGLQLVETMDSKKLSKKEKFEKAVRQLRMMGIPAPEKRMTDYPHQFSGGMRQRAMIAIALAPNPKLLLADEPTTALDVTIQDQIIKLLLSLRDRLDMSMILVTHDLGVASQMCDRIAVMYAGRSMECAAAGKLLRTPRHPYTIGLLRSLPSQSARGRKLTPINGAPPDLSREISGCPFAPRCFMAKPLCGVQFPETKTLSEEHEACCHFVSETEHTALSQVTQGKAGDQHD